jgi:hypothetical protein
MIDINKTYRYRNGEEARVICVDAPHNQWPVIALDGGGVITRHTDMGVSSWELDYDLIEVKEKKVLWLNVYESPFEGFIYRDRERSDDEAYDRERIARIRVEYEEGQFDE